MRLAALALCIIGYTGIAMYAKWTDNLRLQLIVISPVVLLTAVGLLIGRRQKLPQKSEIIAKFRHEMNKTKPGLGDTAEGIRIAEEMYALHDAARGTGKPPNPDKISALVNVIDPNEAPDEVYYADAQLARIESGDAFREWAQTQYPNSRLRKPHDAQVSRVAARLDAANNKKKKFSSTPPIAVIRHTQTNGHPPASDTSWLGGLPALGGLSWPVGPTSKPMHHLAQIDLRSLNRYKVPKGLPKAGSLAFFASTDSPWPYAAKVLHIPSSDHPTSEIPGDLPPLFDGPDREYHITGYTRQDAPKVFPCWSVDFAAPPKGTNDLHQMFGQGTEIQTAVQEHAFDHLLLQLQSDQAMNWMWGDVGVMQFWISPKALRDQQWDQVEVTMEGH